MKKNKNSAAEPAATGSRLGLRENWQQFTLLVIVNAFVGGMVGLERSILPQMAEENFGLAATTAVLSFILVFGVVKALANYYAGALANKLGRKRLLIIGWLFAVPVPLMLMYAPHWNWVIAANVLLGINQGLAWSSTVVMKIDLVGQKQRGLAMGLNEFAGYLAVALLAYVTALIAAEWGLRPYPFYLGIALVALGLLTSILFVKDTVHHLAEESADSPMPRLPRIFGDTSWRHPNLGAVTQAGLVNNLNDGMAWGIFPILLTARGFSLAETGIVTAVYPAVWGIGQLLTGRLADIFRKKDLLFTGMLIQALALAGLTAAESLQAFIALAAVLGWGTAMVYPTFLATVADNTHPRDRAKAIGIFRLWRDLGYAVGALLTGIVADAFNTETSIGLIAAITAVSAIVIALRMNNRYDRGRPFLPNRHTNTRLR